jgi:hypothetical protein
MEETQAGGIEFEVTYPVAPSYAPFRQKSLGDCTRPLLMGANEGPAWRLMSTLCTIGGRKVQVFTASGSGWFTVPPDETRVGTPMRRSQWSVVFTASGSGWFTVPPDETRVGTPMRRSQWSVVFTASGSGWFTVPPDETRVGTPMRRSQWSVYIYSQWSVYSIYILGLPCVVHLSVGDLARAPDVAGARCPLTPRPPSVAAFRCPLPPRVEVTLARCRAAAHRRAVYANLARAPAGTGLRPSAGFALPRWRSLVARRADGGLCRVAPCGDHARALPCRRPPTRASP